MRVVNSGGMVSFLRTKLTALWRTIQVELQGAYSVGRVKELFAYSNNESSLRVLIIPLLTPLPSLILITVVDLVPLRPIAEGIHANHLFFVRAFVSVWIATVMTYVQFKHIVKSMPLSTVQTVGISGIIAVLTVCVMYLLALNVGFPLPFGSIMVSPVWLPLVVLPLSSWMKRARADPVVWPFVINSLKIMACQEALVTIYPMYFYLFRMVPEHGKTGFAALLPVLKLVLRNIVAKTVEHMNDEIPEIVILNVELFSALFVSYCMQNTPSVQTTLVLMAADALQMAASLYDIELVVQRLKAIRRQIGVDASVSRYSFKTSEYQVAQDIVDRHVASSSRRFSSFQKSLKRLSATIRPLNNDVAKPQVATREHNSIFFQLDPILRKESLVGPHRRDVSSAFNVSKEAEYVHNLRKVLYITEFVVLLNYVEVVIPIIYAAYLFTMYHLPNRAFYEQMADMEYSQLQNTLFNVFLYSGLQLVSLFILNGVLWHRMRFSVFRQLAFVLERQCSRVQNRLIFWVYYNVQSSLQHCGFDYSFKFAWLKGHPNLPP